MKSVLLQLYSGEINPSQHYIPTSQQYKSISSESFQYYEDFLSHLDSPLKEQFLAFMDKHLGTTPYESSEMFIQGFRLGVKMMIEVFCDSVIEEE